MARGRLTVDEYASGVLAGDRTILGRAITLIESRLASDYELAQSVLQRVAGHTGTALRVGVTGAPGVGKSTFIDKIGMMLVERGHRVAVLAVDPSSSISGGSVLGDKTRMAELAQDDRAFIRPSPSALSLGGVTRRTRETMMLCEAAGYDVVFVETVGVGQSEITVADMVDFFCVLMLPGAGDELQGMKKGILELADVIAVNKADGEAEHRAIETCRDYAAALKYLHPRTGAWKPTAMTCSAVTGKGIEALWKLIEDHRAALEASGDLESIRREQKRRWMWSMIEERLLSAFRDHADVKAALGDLEQRVIDGTETPTRAAETLLAAFGIGAFHED